MRVNDTIEIDDREIGIHSTDEIFISPLHNDLMSYLNEAQFVENKSGGGDIRIQAGTGDHPLSCGNVLIQDGSGRARIEMEDGNIRIIAKEISFEREEKDPDDGRKLGKVTIVDESRLKDFEDEPSQFKKDDGKHRGGFYNYGWKVAEQKKKAAKEPPKSTEWFLKRTPHYHDIMNAKRKFDVLREPLKLELNYTSSPVATEGLKPLKTERIASAAKKITDSSMAEATAKKVESDDIKEQARKTFDAMDAEAKKESLKDALKTLNKYAKVLDENLPVDPVKDAQSSVDHVKQVLNSNPEYGGVTHGYTCSTNQGSPDGASFWRASKDGSVGLRYNNMHRRAENQKQIEDLVNKYIDDVASVDENYRKLMADVLRRDVEVRKIIKSFSQSKACPAVATKGLSEVIMNLNKDHVWKEPIQVTTSPKGFWSRIRNRVSKWISRKV